MANAPPAAPASARRAARIALDWKLASTARRRRRAQTQHAITACHSFRPIGSIFLKCEPRPIIYIRGSFTLANQACYTARNRAPAPAPEQPRSIYLYTSFSKSSLL